MKKGQDVLTIAKEYIGSRYILGSFAPKDEKNYSGSFDCAEFVSYCIFQTFGILYGCSTSDILRADKADAYTGFFDRDATKKGIIITVEQAARTPGAILLRVPTGSAIGHVVFSNGDGKTTEAHSASKGVIQSKVDGRRWSYGILLPEIPYKENKVVKTAAPPVVFRLKKPFMQDEFIGKIQKALKIPVDGVYGPITQAAVVFYQKKAGLIPDGEVMPGGQTAKSLGI